MPYFGIRSSASSIQRPSSASMTWSKSSARAVSSARWRSISSADASQGYMPLKRTASTSWSSSSCVVPERVLVDLDTEAGAGRQLEDPVDHRRLGPEQVLSELLVGVDLGVAILAPRRVLQRRHEVDVRHDCERRRHPAVRDDQPPARARV